MPNIRTHTKHPLFLWAALALAACSSATGPDAGSSGEVAMVVITPSVSTVALGAQLPLQASVQDVRGQVVPSAQVVWSVKDPTIASVSSAGVVTALALGTTQVAANANGKSAIATVTVQKTGVASVIVRPDRADVTAGQKVQLTAVAYDAAQNVLADRAIIWSSSNVGVATVDASGMLTGVGAGTATITATSEDKRASATITVVQGAIASITVTPNPIAMNVGQSVQAVATSRDAGGGVITGRAIVWASSNLSTATVAQDGTVTGVGSGSATITATSEGQVGTTAVTISNVAIASVAIVPASGTITSGASIQLSTVVTDVNGGAVSGRLISWSSSNPAVATVNSAGLVTGVAPGTTVITGNTDGRSGTATITVTQTAVGSLSVTPTSSSITTGQTTVLTANVADANGAPLTGRVVAWSSSNPAIATVSQAGVVTGIAAGTVTITATSEGKSGAAAVTVTLPAPGIPTPPAVGSVTVSPPSASVVQGQTAILSATVKDANGNLLTDRTVAWSTSNSAVATVSQSGVVTGLTLGTVTITASTGGRGGTSVVTVTAPAPVPVNTVTVSPSTATLTLTQSVALAATTRDANGNLLTGRSVTWSTSNAAVATVSATGMVTAVAQGSATITATSEGKTGVATITVTPTPVATVTVSPTTATLTAGQLATVQLAATTKDANGNTLTGRAVTWTSSNTAVATVSSTGAVTAGTTAGTATITATSEGQTGSATITVVAAATATVTVTPAPSTVKLGSTVQLTATARDAYGNVISGKVFNWASSNNNASVTSTGLVSGLRVGTANITASISAEAKSGSSTVTVTP